MDVLYVSSVLTGRQTMGIDSTTKTILIVNFFIILINSQEHRCNVHKFLRKKSNNHSIAWE
jgi:hypothetical protein